jgi:hypothetical protein
MLIKIVRKCNDSIATAQKEVGVSETTIRRRLRDPNYSTWKELDRVEHGYRKVSIEGQEFESINAAVEAGLAKDRFTVMRRLKSTQNKWKDWVQLVQQ